MGHDPVPGLLSGADRPECDQQLHPWLTVGDWALAAVTVAQCFWPCLSQT